MLLQILESLFSRDLNRLKGEIQLYRDERKIWYIEKYSQFCRQSLSAPGNNLNAYIGTELGKTNYIRQRDLEFSLKDIPRTELVKRIDNTVSMIQKVLGHLTSDDLLAIYPVMVFDKEMSTEYFLAHLATHLNYHLGQVNYHRRLLDAE